MIDKADDELIKRLIEEAETVIKEKLQTKLNQAHQSNLQADETDTPNPPKRRRGRPKKVAQKDSTTDSQTQPPLQDTKPSAVKNRNKAHGEMMVKEAILEFIEREDGTLVLQEVGNEDEPMVTIRFSEQVKTMIGKDEVQNVGQNMIHAAITTVMQRQINTWHAYVYDEKPSHYS